LTWEDRLKTAAYTSPNGQRVSFDYEDVSKSFDKKTAAFNFPDADGTYIQDLGHSGRRYPLRVIFWGSDYDLASNEFEVLLQQKGQGKLEHPIYGTIDVVPFGTITRRDDLKTAANQAIIQVTFWETTGVIYPASNLDPASSILAALDEFNASASETFENALSLDSSIERVTAKNQILAVVDQISDTMQPIIDLQDDVRSQFNAIEDSINRSIDVLIGEPLTLAFQTVQLIQSPARAVSAIADRLTAYGSLTDSIVNSVNSIVSPGNDSTNSNTFHIADLNASSYVTGSVLSTVNNTFETKTDAINAADVVFSQFDEVVEWREANFNSLLQVDTGESYQKLQEAVALTAGFLIEISFSLKQERTIVLDRNRTIIDLSAEIYGQVDEQLDFLIDTNNLTGSEILELPRGREIVYYI
jgi:hypothetical protein